MALVNYSDSETSDTEDIVPVAPAAAKPTITKPALTRSTNPSEPRKIKVDLPAVKPEISASIEEEQPPAKKARTAGAFSGFNSLLPAPKRVAVQNAPKAGVSLKTSGEAAFARNAPPSLEDGEDGEAVGGGMNGVGKEVDGVKAGAEDEVKVVGKATKFKPLSVGNKKKSTVKKAKVEDADKAFVEQKALPSMTTQSEKAVVQPAEPPPPPPKPKRSLFSLPQQEEYETTTAPLTGTYESLTAISPPPPTNSDISHNSTTISNSTTTNPQPIQPPPHQTSLDELTSDLNLTPAQKRQIFGRNSTNKDINLAHFNMDSEYAANEELRQAGEVVEHRAVKAIAPGKHSLQQLVNNARSQQENLEDKWAAGRKERGGLGRR